MKKNKKSIFFPILVNLHKLPCLVIGGGSVALRKVTTLLNFKIRVTVIAPNICKPLKELSKKNEIKIIQKSYNKDSLKKFDIIFCATDNPQINQTVSKDCKNENKLLNVADVPELCDFILPAVVKRGDLTISVSSQGSAPFYAKEIKNKLNNIFPACYEDIIKLAGDYRKMVLKSKKLKSPKDKEKAFSNFFLIDWQNVITTEDKKKQMNIYKNLCNELTEDSEKKI